MKKTMIGVLSAYAMVSAGNVNAAGYLLSAKFDCTGDAAVVADGVLLNSEQKGFKGYRLIERADDEIKYGRRAYLSIGAGGADPDPSVPRFFEEIRISIYGYNKLLIETLRPEGWVSSVVPEDNERSLLFGVSDGASLRCGIDVEPFEGEIQSF